MRVTLAQVDLIWEDPQQNRLDLEGQILSLTGESDLVFLPETFTTGFSVKNIDLAEPMDGPTINWLLKLSATVQIAIGGSLIIKEGDKIFNRFVFVQPDGQVSFYDKRHLFSIGGEARPFVNGNKKLIINYLGWRIALYICFDLRFPVWCRNVDDTDIMIFTANWPASRSEAWKVLLKARAIENQVYVAGINRIGADGNNILYSGDSQIVGPKGEILSEICVSESGLPTYEISMQELDDYRKKFPVTNDAERFTIN